MPKHENRGISEIIEALSRSIQEARGARFAPVSLGDLLGFSPQSRGFGSSGGFVTLPSNIDPTFGIERGGQRVTREQFRELERERQVFGAPIDISIPKLRF